jgi:hypothetical protein
MSKFHSHLASWRVVIFTPGQCNCTGTDTMFTSACINVFSHSLIPEVYQHIGFCWFTVNSIVPGHSIATTIRSHSLCPKKVSHCHCFSLLQQFKSTEFFPFTCRPFNVTDHSSDRHHNPVTFTVSGESFTRSLLLSTTCLQYPLSAVNFYGVLYRVAFIGLRLFTGCG